MNAGTTFVGPDAGKAENNTICNQKMILKKRQFLLPGVKQVFSFEKEKNRCTNFPLRMKF